MFPVNTTIDSGFPFPPSHDPMRRPSLETNQLYGLSELRSTVKEQTLRYAVAEERGKALVSPAPWKQYSSSPVPWLR